MAPVNIKYIVSFSSQDDKHKANNLINGNDSKKWLSHPKDRSGRAEVVLQLEAPTLLQYLDIGVIWCAFLEVRVGRSDWPQSQEFATLVPTVSLMSPTDCLLRRGISSSCMFSKNDFNIDLASKPWDRIQLVCRQPFRKDAQFGISFIHIKSQCSLPSPVLEKPGAKECKEQDAVKSSKNVELIKSHFFGNQHTSASPSKADQLKSRLLRISGSAEQEGVGPFQALSRTAQIVMKASAKAESLSPHRKQIPPHHQGRLFSEHVSTRKNDVAIDDEIKTFLPTLKITVADIDRVTIADLRHKFEKSKKRKLTCEEKKIFLQLSQEFFSDLLDGHENELQAPGRTASVQGISSKLRSSCEDSNSNLCEDQANLSMPNTPEVQKNQQNSERSKISIFSSSPSSPRSECSTEIRHSRQSTAPNRVLHSQTLQTSEPLVWSSFSTRQNVVHPDSESDQTKCSEISEVNSPSRNGRQGVRKTKCSSSSLERKAGHTEAVKRNNPCTSPNSLSSPSYVVDNLISSTTSTSDHSSCPRRTVQTFEKVNKSFEDLHNTFMAPSYRLPAKGVKRKLNQGCLSLLDTFRQEIEEDDSGDNTSASVPNHNHSPWLNATKRKVNAEECNILPSAESHHCELEKKDSSVPLRKSSKKVTAKRNLSPTPSPKAGKKCRTCQSVIPHSALAAHQRICTTATVEALTGKFMSSSTPISPEGESGLQHLLESEQISHEFFIDDEEFGECPICMQSFPLSSLPVHASECGL